MSRRLPLRQRLVLTEVEPALLPLLRAEVRASFGDDSRVAVIPMDLRADMPAGIAAAELDTIVSFNVLEHIENDIEALRRLAALLRHGSSSQPRRIVSFVPAHDWAYGRFDQVYGHFRRYTAATFRALAAEACPDFRLQTRYFNVFGLPGWVLFGKVLRRETIGTGALRWFERLCPYIRPADDLLHRLGLPLGQSLIAVLTLHNASGQPT
jgi:hypothetical protein